MRDRESPPNFRPPSWSRDAAAPRFSMGKRVRLGPGAPTALHGIGGVIERVAGHFVPAHSREAAPLYRLRIALADLWREGAFELADTLDLEVFEPMLAPFFDYGDFEGEQARLAKALAQADPVNDAARLEALEALASPAPQEAEINLEPEAGARHLVLGPDLDPARRRAALRRPRDPSSPCGAAQIDAALRLHLASGRIGYAITGRIEGA